jgi:hypothetical protein
MLSLDVHVGLPSFAYRDIARWGFNAVRLSIPWNSLEPKRPTRDLLGNIVHHWNPRFLEVLDRTVAGFRSHGVAGVLTRTQHLWSPALTNLPHGGTTFEHGAGMPAWLYPKGGGLCQMVRAEKRFFIHGVGQRGFINAWQFLAKRYEANPAVIGADILNEPYDILTAAYPCTNGATRKTMKLAHFYEHTGRAIGAVNPHLLRIFEEQRSRRTNRWALTRRPRLANAVFSMHLYAQRWVGDGQERLSQAHRRARGWVLPMWVGEWTMYNRTTGWHTAHPGWKKSSRRTLAYCKRHHIGWSILGYGKGDFQRRKNIRRPKRRVLPIVQGGF